MRRLFLLALVSLFPLAAGCSETSIDGSSEESFHASYEALREELEPRKRERLEEAVLTIGIADLRLRGLEDEAAATRSLLARLDGKTADELIEEGKVLRTASAER